MNSVYDYLDYRKFLKDRMAALKAKGPAFSIRNIGRRAGLKSSGHLNLIIGGKRNLGQNSLYKVCEGLCLAERESQFLVNLVNFNQAKTIAEKDHFYRRLLKSYPPRHAKLIDSKHYRMFSHWYYIAILELARTDGFRADPSWISKKLRPRISEGKARAALDDLLNLELLKKAGNRVEPGDRMIAAPDAIKNVLITNFQTELSRLAVESLKRDPVDDKEFSTLTIAVSKEEFAEAKKRIQELKRELHALIELSGGRKTQVVHLNLQLFKLSSEGGTL